MSASYTFHSDSQPRVRAAAGGVLPAARRLPASRQRVALLLPPARAPVHGGCSRGGGCPRRRVRPDHWLLAETLPDGKADPDGEAARLPSPPPGSRLSSRQVPQAPRPPRPIPLASMRHASQKFRITGRVSFFPLHVLLCLVRLETKWKARTN